jgi:hypothetical protein
MPRLPPVTRMIGVASPDMAADEPVEVAVEVAVEAAVEAPGWADWGAGMGERRAGS